MNFSSQHLKLSSRSSDEVALLIKRFSLRSWQEIHELQAATPGVQAQAYHGAAAREPKEEQDQQQRDRHAHHKTTSQASLGDVANIDEGKARRARRAQVTELPDLPAPKWTEKLKYSSLEYLDGFSSRASRVLALEQVAQIAAKALAISSIPPRLRPHNGQHRQQPDHASEQMSGRDKQDARAHVGTLRNATQHTQQAVHAPTPAESLSSSRALGSPQAAADTPSYTSSLSSISTPTSAAHPAAPAHQAAEVATSQVQAHASSIGDIAQPAEATTSSTAAPLSNSSQVSRSTLQGLESPAQVHSAEDHTGASTQDRVNQGSHDTAGTLSHRRQRRRQMQDSSLHQAPDTQQVRSIAADYGGWLQDKLRTATAALSARWQTLKGSWQASLPAQPQSTADNAAQHGHQVPQTVQEAESHAAVRAADEVATRPASELQNVTMITSSTRQTSQPADGIREMSYPHMADITPGSTLPSVVHTADSELANIPTHHSNSSPAAAQQGAALAAGVQEAASMSTAPAQEHLAMTAAAPSPTPCAVQAPLVSSDQKASSQTVPITPQLRALFQAFLNSQVLSLQVRPAPVALYKHALGKDKNTRKGWRKLQRSAPYNAVLPSINELRDKLPKYLGLQHVSVQPSAHLLGPGAVDSVQQQEQQQRQQEAVDLAALEPAAEHAVEPMLSPAEMRRTQLLKAVQERNQELLQLQGDLRSQLPSAIAGAEVGDASHDAQHPGISLSHPVFMISRRIKAVKALIAKDEDELHNIAMGHWKPVHLPDSLSHFEASMADALQSTHMTEQDTKQNALQDLMDVLGPAPSTTRGTTRGRTSRRASQAVSSIHNPFVATARAQSQPSAYTPNILGSDGSLLARPGGNANSKPSAPAVAVSKEGQQQVAAWVDDFLDQDFLGPGQAGHDALGQLSNVDTGAAPLHDRHVPALRSTPALDNGSAAEKRMEPLEIEGQVSVRQLAQLLGTSPWTLESWVQEVVGEQVSSEEDVLSSEAVELAALEWGYTPIMTGQAHLGPVQPRPPVVTIMGHVDHGKTSLLDALRHSSVAANEAGGITQHIGAFEVQLPGAPLPITFLDTPGHAAFSAMRARGAAVTDIVVLVVAADDGVMPQTREALAHARAAGCPLVVALTKCDLPGANPDAVKQSLLAEGVELEAFGGSVQLVHTSARTGLGLQELQEALQLQAEIMELQAPVEGVASAVVVEASQGRSGPQATVIVQRGRLTVGDACVVGTEYGKVRALSTSAGLPVPNGAVGPGQHALVLGLRGLPAPGDELKVVASEDRARAISAARGSRQEEYRHAQLLAVAMQARRAAQQQAAKAQVKLGAANSARMSVLAERNHQTAKQLEQMAMQKREALAAGSTPTPAVTSAAPSQHTTAVDTPAALVSPPCEEVRVVVKADVSGSVEAVKGLAAQLSSNLVNIKVLHAGVGPLTLGDVNLAVTAGAHLVTFNLGGTAVPNSAVEAALQRARLAGVQLLQHNVVYHLMDELRTLAQGAVPYVDVQQVVGSAQVLASFPLSATSSRKARAAGLLPEGGARIAGIRVTEGSIQRGNTHVRVLRNGKVLHEGRISSLKRHKLDVDTVGHGSECGLVLDDGVYSDWQPGDVLQCIATVRQRSDLLDQDALLSGAADASWQGQQVAEHHEQQEARYAGH